MDLIASLCHNYHASEERLKEMMDKSHKAIEDVFSMKALSSYDPIHLDLLHKQVAHMIPYI